MAAEFVSPEGEPQSSHTSDDASPVPSDDSDVADYLNRLTTYRYSMKPRGRASGSRRRANRATDGNRMQPDQHQDK